MCVIHVTGPRRPAGPFSWAAGVGKPKSAVPDEYRTQPPTLSEAGTGQRKKGRDSTVVSFFKPGKTETLKSARTDKLPEGDHRKLTRSQAAKFKCASEGQERGGPGFVHFVHFVHQHAFWEAAVVAAKVANLKRGDNQHTEDGQICPTSIADMKQGTRTDIGQICTKSAAEAVTLMKASGQWWRRRWRT